MKEKFYPFTAFCAAAFISLLIYIGCNNDSSVNNTSGISTTNARISDCGGFGDSMKRWVADDSDETLSWSYDNENRILRIMNTGVSLNCCGNHSIAADVSDLVITVSEIDQEPEEGRCRCTCVFDFSIDITGLPENTYTLIMKRYIDDESSALIHTSINLAEPYGSITVE